MSRIELRRICKRYGDGQPLAINGVDLEILPGEFCVFVGPSGCGKSTLLRMVAGLEDITSGELLIQGQLVNRVPAAQRGVAMVFQSYALYPHMTVYENIAFGLRVNGVASAEVDRQVRQAAQILQLEPLLQRKPKALSGGQRQRVAIGRAIVKQPKVFLFDEPLSNLDASLRAATRMEIAKLHRQIGTASMIYVTHDQVEAMTLAQKIVLLHAGDRIASHGSVAQVGTPMDLYHRPSSLFVATFIGSPQINVLPAQLLSVTGGMATLSVGVQCVQAAVDATHLTEGCDVQLAVRPEHLKPGAVEGGAVLHGCVGHMEQLGDSALVQVELPHLSPIVVRLDGHAPHRVGDPISVTLMPQTLHVFDSQGMACRRTVELPA